MEERKAIITAMLDLAREGRLSGASLSEIAFRARLAESTAKVFFKSKDEIIAAVDQYIVARLDMLLSGSDREGKSFKSIFFMAWTALFDFYVLHPEILAFVEYRQHYSNNNIKSEETNFNIYSFLSAVDDDPKFLCLDMRVMASLFHSNVIAASRLKIHYPDLSHNEIKNFVNVLWTGITSLKTEPTIL